MSVLLYNPDKKIKKDLINEFVVRTDIFNQIFEDIKSSKMKHPEQNYLIFGQRGSGKTTLITRLKYAIEDDVTLNKWLIPIVFSEEQYNISELVNVWENVATYLEDYYGFKGLSEEIGKNSSRKDFESLSLEILIKYLSKYKKKIVLFIDNFGDLLSKFDELEIRRLREILQTRPEIRLIAGSSVPLEDISGYHQPLYEFFKLIQLKGLTYDESIELLKKLAEVNNETKKIRDIIKKSPSRIETLRTLSGGVPRTIALLFQVFIDNEHGSSVSDLQKILDAVTPLYKHRMDDLPKQQQKIVDAVARNWEAVSVKELTEKLRIESKIISSQLRQLEKNQIIEKRITNTKNHIYLIKERFFNIWYLMRYGRKQDRERVVWLVKFLEMWCDKNEIEKRILDYIAKAKKGLLDGNTLELYAEVYSHFQNAKPETEFLLKDSAPEYLKKYINLSDPEFDNLYLKYSKEKKWEKFLDLMISKETFTYEQKQKINYLILENSSMDFEDAFNKYFNTGKGMQKIDDKNISVPYFYLMHMFNEAVFQSYLLMEKKENEKVKTNFDFIVLLYVKGLQIKADNFEFEKILTYIYFLLIFKYYHLAESFFKKCLVEEKDVDKKYDIFDYLIQYFVRNKDELVFEKLGDEKKEKLLDLVNDISKRQVCFEITGKVFSADEIRSAKTWVNQA